MGSDWRRGEGGGVGLGLRDAGRLKYPDFVLGGEPERRHTPFTLRRRTRRPSDRRVSGRFRVGPLKKRRQLFNGYQFLCVAHFIFLKQKHVYKS